MREPSIPEPSKPEPLKFTVVTRADLRDGTLHATWDDPQRLGSMSEPKRRAMLDNPLALSDSEPVQLVALQGNRPIGRIDLIAGRIVVNNKPEPVFWGSALMVPEEHRATLAGAYLVMRLPTLAPKLCPTLVAHGVSQMALPLYSKLKWAHLTLRRMIVLRHSRSVVERFLGAGPLGKLGTIAADAGLLVHRALWASYRAVTTRGLIVERVDRMPPELDGKLGQASGGGAAVRPFRSAAWIDWALRSRFDADEKPSHPLTRALFLVRDRAGRVIAYFIIKSKFYPVATHRGFKDLTLGSLQDWMIFDAAGAPSGSRPIDLKTVILLASRELARLNVDAIEVCTDEKPALRLMRRVGFIPAGEMHIMVKSSPGGPVAAADMLKPESWQLRPADGDNMF